MVDIAKIMAYENDELDDVEALELFQDLIDDGSAWQLQGSYGRADRGRPLLAGGGRLELCLISMEP